MSLKGNNPMVTVADPFGRANGSLIHPVLQVRPVTKAIWNIYGPPPLARWMLKMAFDELLAFEKVVSERYYRQTKRKS